MKVFVVVAFIASVCIVVHGQGRQGQTTNQGGNNRVGNSGVGNTRGGNSGGGNYQQLMAMMSPPRNNMAMMGPSARNTGGNNAGFGQMGFGHLLAMGVDMSNMPLVMNCMRRLRGFYGFRMCENMFNR